MHIMVPPPAAVTADELLAMPHDGTRHELVRGELRAMSPAGHRHGRVAAEIAFQLRLWLQPWPQQDRPGVVYAAETGFWIERDPDTVRAPDVAFVTRSRVASLADPHGFFPGAPDLAVEVLSPSDTFHAVQQKAFQWLDAGARVVWVVDPDGGTVTVIRARDAIRVLQPDDTLDEPELLPTFAVRVTSFFEP